MPTQSIVLRSCQCGCLDTFEVPLARQGQLYKFGHKPPIARKAVAPTAQEQERRRGLLDYKLTRSTAAAEALELERLMDLFDERIEQARASIARDQVEKDAACARHLALESLLAVLDHLVDGKPLPLPTEEVNDATAA